MSSTPINSKRTSAIGRARKKVPAKDLVPVPHPTGIGEMKVHPDDAERFKQRAAAAKKARTPSKKAASKKPSNKAATEQPSNKAASDADTAPAGD